MASVTNTLLFTPLARTKSFATTDMEVYVVRDHFRCDSVASQNRSHCPWLPVM